jgi:hypothetical protein
MTAPRHATEHEAKRTDLEDVRSRFYDAALDRINEASPEDREKLLAALNGEGDPIVIVDE